MKSLKAKSPIRPQVLEEAADWLVEFRAGDPDSTDRRGFDTWLRTSPEHVRAYLTLLPVWENERFGELDAQPEPDALIQLARVRDGNVVHFNREGREAAGLKPGNTARRFAIAASVAVTVSVAGYFVFSTWRSPVYTTSVGEQTTVNLPDGTTVNLNSRTRIRLRYSERERRIELQQGQALFQVAKDAQRPFIVSTDATQIRAVGTQFDIYRKSTGTVVTVVEGRVAVGEASFLSAGEQLTVTPGAVAKAQKANLKIATAWTRHRLIFSATPLTDVAEEFNRYNTRRLIIDGDPDLRAFRINGVFSSADSTALLGFLREQPGMVITESMQSIHISKK